MGSWPSRFCCDEELAFIGYAGRDAPKDLVAWRAQGLRPTTQELIDAIRAEGVEGATVLDVGAGVGGVHVALLEAGAARAIDVDASRDYQAAAREEATRRGLVDRVTYHYGDVVELAAELPPADIVTLDSVICCYPYLPALITAVMSVSPRLVGLTYPRDVGGCGRTCASTTSSTRCVAARRATSRIATARYETSWPHAGTGRSTMAEFLAGGSCCTRVADRQPLGLKGREPDQPSASRSTGSPAASQPLKPPTRSVARSKPRSRRVAAARLEL